MDVSFDEQAVLQKLNLADASPELQQRMLIRVRQMVAARLQHRLEGEMTSDDYAALAAVTQDKAEAWLMQRFPQYEAWYQEELQVTLDFMAAHAATARMSRRNSR